MTFQQEVKCASDVLNTQLDCVNKLLQYIRQDKKNPPRSFQQEREDYILQNCMFVIEAKIRNFEDMNDEAARQASRVSDIALLMSLRNEAHVYMLEYHPNRIQQRSSRGCNLSLHYRDGDLPSTILCDLFLWHEHLRSAKHEPGAVDLLGERNPSHCGRNWPVALCHPLL